MDTEVQVAIISAIEVEYQTIITIMTSRKTKYTNYTIGKINNMYCVATQSGVGALAVQRSVIDVMKYFKPKLLIFAGTAGSRNPNITVGDVVVSGYICARNSIYFSPDSVLSPYNAVQLKQNNTYIDMTIIPGYKYLCSLASTYGAIIGVLGTSDYYTSSVEWINSFNEVYHTDTGDNESIGLAFAAQIYSVPFIVARGVSDSVYEPNANSFIVGARVVANLVKSLLSNISLNFPLDRITISDLSPISLGAVYGSITSEETKMIPPKVVS